MKRLTITLIGAALFIGALGLHYALPRVSVVEVVGVEVKRADEEQRTRDVYFIQTQLGDRGGIRVFRNEDAWLYLKFDSATLQARVTGLSRDAAVEAVAIRHYGWRIPLLSMFPNAIAAWPVEPDYRHIPMFNIAVLGSLLVAFFMVWRAVKKVRLRIAATISRRSEERAQSRANRSAPPIIDADSEAWLSQDQPKADGSSDVGKGT